nr:MAG: hypothetical protein DIU78_23735 [Pseudomonadota bacterium]
MARIAPVLALVGAALPLTAAPPAAAADDTVVLETEIARAPEPLPDRGSDLELAAFARQVDALVLEAARDLGLRVGPKPETAPSDRSDLAASASEEWLVSPRVFRDAGGFVVELRVVPPRSRVVYARTQRVHPETLEIRLMTTMRDLVEAARGRDARRSEGERARRPAVVTEPARSPGRAVLAFHGALLGGFAGYSIQEASGSNDARLTYPLAALGAGIGLGGSMLVAEEWDISVADAWYLSAGIFWPSLSGWLLADSYDVADEDRYAYALVSAAGGLSLAAIGAGTARVGEGSAALAHSGGAFGTLLGGLAELFVEGTTGITPRRGMGYGAGAGVLVAGALALHLDPSAARVLLVDLGASLGALTGAAAASPLLLVEPTADQPTRTRLWLAGIAAGTFAGGAIALWATRTADTKPTTSTTPIPEVGLVSVTELGPVFGAALRGTW